MSRARVQKYTKKKGSPKNKTLVGNQELGMAREVGEYVEGEGPGGGWGHTRKAVDGAFLSLICFFCRNFVLW